MRVKIRRLEWSNMFSYGADNWLDLDSKIAQLSGLNGHGKTSISLILQELLYSKNVKSIKKSDILNRYSRSKTWSGRVLFSVDKGNYDLRVERTGDASKVKLFKDGQDISEHKIPDTYKKIQGILGMTFEVFSQLVYQSSTDLLDFIKATDTNRKKFLINLFGLERYLEIGDSLKEVLTQQESDSTKLQGELSGVQKFLASAQIGEKQGLIRVPDFDKEADDRRVSLKLQLEQYANICKQIDKNSLLIKERDGLRFDLSMTRPLQDGSLAGQIKTLEAAVAATGQQIRTLEQQKSKVDTKDTCYACGQHIDNSKGVEILTQLTGEISKLEVELVDLRLALQERRAKEEQEKKQLKLWITNQAAIQKFEQLSQLIDTTCPTDYPDYKSIEQEHIMLTSNLDKLNKSIQDAIKYNTQVNIHNTKVDTLRDQKREFLARQELLEKSILEYKIKISHLNILRKAFSTSGIVAFKLENLTKQLETGINRYLAELSDGQFQITFRLTGEKLNIVVSNNGKESPIETFSGGEFGRIQTSILLAIRSVLSKIGGSEINVLFLDEITGVLDAAGKERLVDILLEEDANTFFISHDFEHPLIEKIHIVKEHDISKIIR